jgi:hypothetical protein
VRFNVQLNELRLIDDPDTSGYSASEWREARNGSEWIRYALMRTVQESNANAVDDDNDDNENDDTEDDGMVKEMNSNNNVMDQDHLSNYASDILEKHPSFLQQQFHENGAHLDEHGSESATKHQNHRRNFVVDRLL